MRKFNFKVVLLLYLLFILDLLRPFGLYFLGEFLFLGLICVSLNFNFFTALVLSMVFGYFKSLFLPSSGSLAVIEFSLLAILVSYLKQSLYIAEEKFPFITPRRLAALIAIILHAGWNTVTCGELFFWFRLQFVIQSFLLYCLLEFLLKKQSANRAIFGS